MVQGAFNHGLRTRLAVFFQQVTLKRATIHADPHGTTVCTGRRHDFTHPRHRADIAGIDPETGRTRISRLDTALIVEMDVGHDRYADIANDLVERRCRGFVRTGYANDVGARLFHP